MRMGDRNSELPIREEYITSMDPSMKKFSSSVGTFCDDDNNGKKYKLRLKFDGGCALEVVRLNGGHFQVCHFYSFSYYYRHCFLNSLGAPCEKLRIGEVVRNDGVLIKGHSC